MNSAALAPLDVAILGAGIVGVCTALSLQEQGHAVTLFDRVGPGTGASHGNAGVISPWSCVPQCLPGVLRQLPRMLLDPNGPVSIHWRALPALLPWGIRFHANSRLPRVNAIADCMDHLMAGNVAAYRAHLHGTGHEHLLQDSYYLNVYRDGQTINRNDLAWTLRQARGAPIDFIGHEELHALEPALSQDCRSAVVIRDQARTVAPGRLCEALFEKAMAQGARYTQTDVQAILPRTMKGPTADTRFTVRTASGDFHCKTVVIALGAASTQLLEPLNIQLPLVAERGYHLEFHNPGVQLSHSIQDVSARIVVSSMEAGIRVAGTAEFAPISAPPNYRRADRLAEQTRKLLPGLDGSDATRWMGARPSFPDSLPVIGELPGLDGMVAAFGHSHYGMGMAPATGRMVAHIVNRDRLNHPLSDLSPARFLDHRV